MLNCTLNFIITMMIIMIVMTIIFNILMIIMSMMIIILIILICHYYSWILFWILNNKINFLIKMLFIIAEAPPLSLVNTASFFGFMGVTCALVLASIIIELNYRHWGCLWNIQVWSRYRSHRNMEAWNYYEVTYSRSHGRYPRYLRNDCCCIALSVG